jgi:transposase-like protein
MKRRILKDIDCMSGTGWVSEENVIECPYCGEEQDIINKITIRKCKECGKIFVMEYGSQYLMRAIEQE